MGIENNAVAASMGRVGGDPSAVYRRSERLASSGERIDQAEGRLAVAVADQERLPRGLTHGRILRSGRSRSRPSLVGADPRLGG